MSVAQQDGYAIGNFRDGEAADIEGSRAKGAESGVAPGAGQAMLADQPRARRSLRRT